MVSDDDAWALSSLGEVGTVRLAIAGVRRAMGYASARVKTDPPTEAADAVDPAPLTDFEIALWALVKAHARLSAVLLQMVERTAEQRGDPVSGEALLDEIEIQQQIRADLALLDQGEWPFGES
jgi:hypothetical protein